MCSIVQSYISGVRTDRAHVFKYSPCLYSLPDAALFRFIEDVGQVAFATVLAIMHSSHEHTRSALFTVSLTGFYLQTHPKFTVSVGHSLLNRSIFPSPSTL